MNKLVKMIKSSYCLEVITYCFAKLVVFFIGEKRCAKAKYKIEMGKSVNLDSPKSLNEKTVWLKLNYMQDNYIQSCDKYLIHEYLQERLGKDYAPPLLFVTKNVRELKMDNIKVFPCIVKVSNGSGNNLIIHNKEQYQDKFVQRFFKRQILISNIHRLLTCEHQYLEKNPYIVVEQLLQDKLNGIPNDYKFFYINGELQFIYCSVDRLGINVRQIYSPDWERQHFIWVKGANKELFDKYENSKSIDKPLNYEKMVEISFELAQDYPMVRIDFYEVEDKVYIGEITLHHGSGSDKFYPERFDLEYGDKLKLPQKNYGV